MSALDDLFDGHYFTDDPHVYIPIDEAQQELAELRAENDRLKDDIIQAVRHLEYIRCHGYMPDGSIDKLLEKYLELE